MAQTDSDRGIDRMYEAGRSTDLDTEAAIRKNMAPIEYEVAFYRDGKPCKESFECKSSERVQMTRKKCSIDPENDITARRMRTGDRGSTWSEPIGDKVLGDFLRKG